MKYNIWMKKNNYLKHVKKVKVYNIGYKGMWRVKKPTDNKQIE